jgi:hypothetical protein
MPDIEYENEVEWKCKKCGAVGEAGTTLRKNKMSKQETVNAIHQVCPVPDCDGDIKIEKCKEKPFEIYMEKGIKKYKENKAVEL